MPENLENKPFKNIKEVNWTLTLYMSLFFGCLGVDRFIMGKVGTGIVKLVVSILLFPVGCIWWLIDLILIMTSHNFEGVKWKFPDKKTVHIIVASVLLVLVLVIFAFIILGLMTTFSRSVFEQSSNELEDDWSDMQLAMKASADNPVLFPGKVTVNSGKTQDFWIRVYNKLANTLYDAKPVIADCINSAGETVSEKITFITRETNIPPGGEQRFFGKIKVSEYLAPDDYVCSVVITADDHKPYVMEYLPGNLIVVLK